MSDRLKNILILGVGSLALGLLWGVSQLWPGAARCPFKALTGIPCPGCGGRRALDLVLQGRFCDALWLNPLSVALMIFFAVSAVWLAVDVVRGTRTWLDFMRRKYPWWVTAAAVALLLAGWAWNICKGL